MIKQVVAVLGGTGLQGGGVVDALMSAGKFAVRVASRNPASDAARALAARGVEVVKADLLDPSTLRSALEGAHGAFVVTNFWDPAQMPRETEIGTAAVQTARAAGVTSELKGWRKQSCPRHLQFPLHTYYGVSPYIAFSWPWAKARAGGISILPPMISM